MRIFNYISYCCKHFAKQKEKNSIVFDVSLVVPYFKRCFRNFLNGKAKSSAHEFWSFIILNLIIGNILYQVQKSFNIIFLLEGYLLLITVPFVSLFMRRLNDIGKSKLWLLIPGLCFLLLFFSSSFSENGMIIWASAMLFLVSVGLLLYWSFIPGVRKL